jgi:signal transduction histidine kinase
MVVVLFLTSFVLFITEYGFSYYSKDFFLTFFVFFGCMVLSTILFTFSTNFISSLLLFFLAVSSMILVDYSLTDYLTIRIWMYGAFLIALAERFDWPWNLIITITLSIVFTLLQGISSFLGENLLNTRFVAIRPSEQFSFALLLCICSLFASTLKMLCVMIDKADWQIAHLHGNIAKLSEFNQSLQSYARTADEIATKKERYRISREIHDISGYIFTNIIALMDSIIITGCQNPEKTSETCLTSRIQAQEGLQETRKALRALRTLESAREQGLRAIYKIKGIFEETTGVVVNIESGNMPLSFGEEIDLIVYRIVQEALTNALRHGHATKVSIDFRISDSVLRMNVLDNGSGSKKIIKGIGLAGMEERINQLNGQIEAMNAPEGGFKLSVLIPITERRTE